ncbi:hypothetical protein WICPIJ_000233 [Wickerhamomyces pijperi]|uniref:chitinase n=1 Tax=Wickerhamomyces pijperi TaxID=599730 RepID=A0A9P8TSA8_WICPI|nr:hypothetical protein WICPIJ_000233 [Wickerhamomyces pijperi]
MLFKKLIRSFAIGSESSDTAKSTPPTSHTSQKGKRTCVYFTSWSIYEERNHFPQDIPLDYATNVFLAFANIDSKTGEVSLGDKYADLEYEFKPSEESGLHQKVHGIVRKFVELQTVKYPHIKISLSIGGWSNRENFSKGLNTETKLLRFIDSSIKLVKELGINGIDLDWEYPQNIHEGKIYLQVIKSLRERLREMEMVQFGQIRDSYLLTIASPAFEDKLQYFNLSEMDKFLSFWNLMTYDFAGEWSEKAGYHCNLFNSADGEDEDALCADDGVKYLLKHGIPSEKIVLGMANYGRSFTNTKGLGHDFNGVGRGSSDEGGIWNYNVIIKSFKPSEIFYDAKACSAYVYSHECKLGKNHPEKNLFIGFDNVESVKRKAQYVKSMKLGGGMWWESCGDDYQDEDLCLLKTFVKGLGGKEQLLRE